MHRPAKPKPQTPPHLSTGYAVRVSVFFGALFLIYGVYLPYMPLWLKGQGLSVGQIAIITATPYILRDLVTPAVAFYADRTANHRRTIIMLAWIGVAATLALSQTSGFWPILIFAVAASIAMTTTMPLTEVIALHGMKTTGYDYGRVRLWGSLTFVVANVGAAEVIARTGSSSVVWMLAAAFAITLIAAHFLPRADRDMSQSEGTHALSLGMAARLAVTPLFVLFLIAGGTVQAAHATYYTFATLHWTSQGITPLIIGALWALGVIAEVVLFAFSGRVVAWIGIRGLLITAAASAVIRWTAMSVDPPLWALFPLQLLHGMTFGAAHIAAIHFMSQAVPEKLAGTAQALYASVGMGLAMAIATLISGVLYERFAGGAYLGMAGLAALGLIAALAMARLWRGGYVIELHIQKA
ncbi:Major facilitator superfamily protein [Candidatus Filomicrobium marinum]|uniref:Major facilitator superfamily protein n=2 Tax=Candidatus Filomicrobium marinum TaxID=1608628 RepID=A0A0D6JHX3_9HYPH|nr:MFS transporter [Candidatus Filomicrobium marinum]CFX40675.1 Major facilitator superfamily protein [Candidatus Filomicrobium marinum]CPR21274.1 Major facilitator superfamily protein [Candidatus Filomicrobium marinum]